MLRFGCSARLIMGFSRQYVMELRGAGETASHPRDDLIGQSIQLNDEEIGCLVRLHVGVAEDC
jgi:hypothetical protein